MKDMNKYILGILKKMVKNPNIRKTETWTESKKEMISILTKVEILGPDCSHITLE